MPHPQYNYIVYCIYYIIIGNSSYWQKIIIIFSVKVEKGYSQFSDKLIKLLGASLFNFNRKYYYNFCQYEELPIIMLLLK